MKNKLLMPLVLIFAVSLGSNAIAGWNPKKGEDKKVSKIKKREDNAAIAIATFKDQDSALEVFFNKAYGYAVFPTVGKGGIGIGGAFGKGVVYERGAPIGTTSLTQVSYGFQLGGAGYSEIIFFKDKAAIDTFIQGNFEFGAGASAVALTVGISADTDYSNGVAVFTLPKGGLMYEATISGQKFKFKSY